MRGDGWRGAAMGHQLDAAERFARGERVFLHELIPLWAPEELEAFVIIARMVQRFGGFEANRNDACRRILKNRGIVEGQPLPPEAVWPNEQLSRALNYDWGLGAKWDQVDKKVREVLVQPNIQTGFVDTKSDYGDIRECHHRMWARRRIGMPRPDVVDENGLFLKRLKVFGSESRQTWCAVDIEVCARDINSGNEPSPSLSTAVNRQKISRLVSENPEAVPRDQPQTDTSSALAGSQKTKRGYDDDRWLKKMKAGLESGEYPNLWQAASACALGAGGSEEEQVREKRLVRKFKAKYRE
ncbi:hypothetical protein Gbth_017_083 [Gluconobacter thailandicus F149-1 = NBRC 100600]|nr:hypothetical protein Gbth_017_083 [Gluconobacter thailandicus F149-1 = NBRC 100600]GBR61519.1 hypothetical protein AA100600_2858 [Gluconobacter thailandicus F149-1 = NBRC 100600]GEL87543.1 hypothetical protein GTH01_19010 [Gluconobacter thailandicus F149-1 = NBRC 100600]